jgi:hypothetical protein
MLRLLIPPSPLNFEVVVVERIRIRRLAPHCFKGIKVPTKTASNLYLNPLLYHYAPNIQST